MPHDSIIESLLPHLQAWWGTITVILTLCGFILFFSVLAGMGSRRPGGRPAGRQILALICAAFLINSHGFLDVLASTLFGGSSVTSLSYRAPAHPARQYIQFAVYLTALVGLIGIGRGILILKDYDREPGRLGTALAHIFGGILCVNLVTTLKVIGRSMGREVLDLITAVTG